MGLRDEPQLDRPLTLLDLGDETKEAPRLTVEVWLPLGGGTGPPRLLMLHRSAARGGFWQCVSGRVEAADQTLRDAALREVQEETGLCVDSEAVLDLQEGYAFVHMGRWFRKRSLAIWLPDAFDLGDVKLSDEHVEARILPFDEARGLLSFDNMKAELDALRRIVNK